jgi:hypothetical protein
MPQRKMADFFITLGIILVGLILPAIFIAWVGEKIEKNEKKNKT